MTARPESGGNPRLRPSRTDPRRYGLLRLREAVEGVILRHLAGAAGGRTAVDLGCGTMPYRELFLPHVARFVGADLPGNPAADAAIDPETGRSDLPAGCADVVLSTQVLEHAASPAAHLAEAARLLRPGGILVLSTHGIWPYHPDPCDFWRWTGDGLRRTLEEAGFEVAECAGILGLGATGAGLVQDALSPRVPEALRPLHNLLFQWLVGFLDRRDTDAGRRRNAAVFLAVCRPRAGAPG